MEPPVLRILFLTYYYQPDLSAGSFRARALVEALLARMPAGSKIDVITTLPTRYSSFSPDAPEREALNGVTIHRVALPKHSGKVVDQSMAFSVYARAVRRLVRGERYDLVVGTSSRLMTAALSAYVAKSIKAPLYLDIRDIFVDTINDVFSGAVAQVAKPVFKAIEAWTIKSAKKVNVVSEGFLPYFDERYDNVDYSFFTNGIDKEFVEAQPTGQSLHEGGPVKVVYAGNFGEGQGLHRIVPELAASLSKKIHFTLIGDGGRKAELIDTLNRLGCKNVEVLAPVPREKLIPIYQDADVLFLHLNDYPAFEKVLPSKIFEYGAMGKPIWAGVSGYAAKFLKENVENAAVFHPCDPVSGEQSLSELTLSTALRQDFVSRYSRANIMLEMADDIIATAKI